MPLRIVAPQRSGPRGALPSSGWHSQQVCSRWSHCRPKLAASLGGAFARGELSERERAVAAEVFSSLLHDTEVEVRRTLAEHIRASPLLPHGIAMKMAEDVESVALPVLQSSPVLTDDDLLLIISRGSSAKLCAIAGRATLSEAVSDALVGTGRKTVVEMLLANDGAAISEAAYHSILEQFAQETSIHELLVERPVLPFAVKEQLVSLVSRALQARLMERHDVPAQLVAQLTRHGRERALLASLAALRGGRDIDAAVSRLALTGALTPTLLLRVLAAGQLQHFAAALARLAKVPSAKAKKALRQTGVPALVALYERSDLPAQLLPAFKTILDVVLAQADGEPLPQAQLEARIVEELVHAYRQISPDSLESVIHQLGRLGPSD